MANYGAKDIGEIINIGTGVDCTINELVESIKNTIQYQCDIRYDTKKPDGTPQKLLDVSKMNQLGWTAKVSLNEGLQLTYADYVQYR